MDGLLRELASLLARRNAIDDAIAALIARPATPGHIGEFIAARVFDIELYTSASHKAADGTFRSGPLRGASVNIKLSGKQEGLVDLREDAIPDYYLVLTGPRSAAGSSRGGTRPILIKHAFLFRGQALHATIGARGKKPRVATSVRQAEWKEAEIWPESRSPHLRLDPDQAAALRAFSGNGGA
jgi:hypothetical protein